MPDTEPLISRHDILSWIGGAAVSVDHTLWLPVEEDCLQCNVCEIGLDIRADVKPVVSQCWFLIRTTRGIVFANDDELPDHFFNEDEERCPWVPELMFPDTILNLSGWLLCLSCTSWIKELILLEDMYRTNHIARSVLTLDLGKLLLPGLALLTLEYLAAPQSSNLIPFDHLKLLHVS